MKRLIAIVMSLVLLCGCAAQSIGTIQGAEFDEIVIDGVVYIRDDADQHQSYTAADKGGFLGTVTNGDETFRVYAIDGTESALYVQWDYEGTIYVRTE